jgi:hypothetical protein
MLAHQHVWAHAYVRLCPCVRTFAPPFFTSCPPSLSLALENLLGIIADLQQCALEPSICFCSSKQISFKFAPVALRVRMGECSLNVQGQHCRGNDATSERNRTSAIHWLPFDGGSCFIASIVLHTLTAYQGPVSTQPGCPIDVRKQIAGHIHAGRHFQHLHIHFTDL